MFTRIWQFFFPNVYYVVYMNGMTIYEGKSKYDAYKCYDANRRQLNIVYQRESNQFTASVSIIKRSKGFNNKAEVLGTQTFKGI